MPFVICLTASADAGIASPVLSSNLLSGLVTWLRADSLSGADGATVSVWPDSAGTNGVAGAATFRTNRINGFPSLNFNGTGQCFAGSNNLVLGSNYTVFIVASKASTVSATELSLFTNGSPTYYAYRDFNYHHNFFTTQWNGANSGTGTAAVPDTKAWAVESFISGTNGTWQFVNGVGGGYTGPASYTVSGRLIVGAQSTSSSFYDGEIAEVLIYTNSLSLADHASVTRYLLQKYLPGPHITFVGDSLTFGQNAATTSSYPCQVMAMLSTYGKYTRITGENLGNQGESYCGNTNAFFTRLAGANRSGNDVVVFWYGANDLVEYDPGYIFPDFLNACQYLKGQGVKVILADNIPRGPLGDGGLGTWYNAQALAAQERASGSNMFDALADLTADLVLGVTNIWTNSFLMNTNDQTHLTAAGYSIVATDVFNQLMPLLDGFAVHPPVLGGATLLANGAFQFSFANPQGFSCTVLSTTNPALPLTRWTAMGPPVSLGNGIFQFTTQPDSGGQGRFYAVRCP